MTAPENRARGLPPGIRCSGIRNHVAEIFEQWFVVENDAGDQRALVIDQIARRRPRRVGLTGRERFRKFHELLTQCVFSVRAEVGRRAFVVLYGILFARRDVTGVRVRETDDHRVGYAAPLRECGDRTSW